MWWYWTGSKWRPYNRERDALLSKHYGTMKRGTSKSFTVDNEGDNVTATIISKGTDLWLRVEKSFFGGVWIKNVSDEMLKRAQERTQFTVGTLRFYAYDSFDCFE